MTRYFIWSIALLLGSGKLDHAAALPAISATLCRADEQPLFSCPLATRLVAVCGGADGAVYRFGRPGHVELEATVLGLAETAFSGGGETQISFRHGGYRYIVFDRTVRTGFAADGHNDSQFSAGLVVQRGDTTVSTQLCRTDATIKAAAAKVLPRSTFQSH